MAQTVLEMAKDLVVAQISAGGLLPEDMQKGLHRAYISLMDLKAKEEAGMGMVSSQANGSAPTALNWRKSIKKSTITCLECGATFKQLSVRHLKDHELDSRSYRSRYGIPRTQPLSAKETTAIRKQIVQRSRPWEKAPTFMKAQAGKAKASANKTRTRK